MIPFCPLEKKNDDIKTGEPSLLVTLILTHNGCFRPTIRIKEAYGEKQSLESSDLQLKGLQNWCDEYSNQQELSFEFKKYCINNKIDGKLDQVWFSKAVKTSGLKFYTERGQERRNKENL